MKLKLVPPAFVPGIYQHYKGDLYWATSLSYHSENEEWLVQYGPMTGPNIGVEFSRPLAMWEEMVDGVKRFSLYDAKKLMGV